MHFRWNVEKMPFQLPVDWNRHGPESIFVSSLRRDDLDYVALHYHVFPFQTAAISETHSRICGDPEEKRPFAAFRAGDLDEARNFLDRKLPPRHRVVRQAVYRVPRIERTAEFFDERPEHVPYGEHVDVARPVCECLFQAFKILFARPARDVGKGVRLRVAFFHPSGETAPCPASVGKRLRIQPSGGGCRGVDVPVAHQRGVGHIPLGKRANRASRARRGRAVHRLGQGRRTIVSFFEVRNGVYCFAERCFVGVVVVARHRRRSVPDDGLHYRERHAGVRGERDERVAQRMERRVRGRSRPSLDHHARLYSRRVEDAAYLVAEHGVVVEIHVGHAWKHVARARVRRRPLKHGKKLRMDRYRHGPAARMLSGLSRYDLENHAGQVYVLPVERAAVAEAKAGVQTCRHQRMPLASRRPRFGEYAPYLGWLKLPPCATVVREASHGTPWVGLDGSVAQERVEHRRKQFQLVVARRGRVGLAVQVHVFVGHRRRDLRRFVRVRMRNLHPLRDQEPRAALFPFGLLVVAARVRRVLVLRPRFRKWNGAASFLDFPSRLRKKTVERLLRFGPVAFARVYAREFVFRPCDDVPVSSVLEFQVPDRTVSAFPAHGKTPFLHRQNSPGDHPPGLHSSFPY